MLLYEKLRNRRLILASKSPRRRELLSAVGLEYCLAGDYDVEECYPDTLPAEEVPEYLALLKSRSYPEQLSGEEILLTADTVVVLEGRILGKPHGREEAVEMLQALSGVRHRVVSGVAIRTAERCEHFSVSSDVWFRPLAREEIEYYVDTFKPFDKAGSYGIQEWIGYAAIERIEGSFYNVMGLPVQQLYVRLDRFLENK